jgi:hypothetical protein
MCFKCNYSHDLNKQNFRGSSCENSTNLKFDNMKAPTELNSNINCIYQPQQLKSLGRTSYTQLKNIAAKFFAAI